MPSVHLDCGVSWVQVLPRAAVLRWHILLLSEVKVCVYFERFAKCWHLCTHKMEEKLMEWLTLTYDAQNKWLLYIKQYVKTGRRWRLECLLSAHSKTQRQTSDGPVVQSMQVEGRRMSWQKHGQSAVSIQWTRYWLLKRNMYSHWNSC